MKPVVAGIDAGGTSVRLILEDAVLGERLYEGAATADPAGGPQPLRALWSEVRQHIEGTSWDVRAVVAGITKFSRQGVVELWKQELRHLCPGAEIRILPDYVIAFHGALPAGRGMIVIAGTGSVIYGENESGTTARVGGRGWEFGDEGSGAWLTTEAVRRTLRAMDGVEAGTPLTHAVIAAVAPTGDAGVLGEAARQRIEVEGRGFLVPLLLERAHAGDAESAELFVGAAGWLGKQCYAAAVRLGLDLTASIPVSPIGGLWSAGDLLSVPFEKVLRRWMPAVVIASPAGEPVTGAVRLARNTLRGPVVPGVVDRLS